MESHVDTIESSVVKQLPILTDRQYLLLEFLKEYRVKNRYMPTHREVATFLDIKSANATAYLTALEKKGYLRRIADRVRRNLELTPAAYEKLSLQESIGETI